LYELHSEAELAAVLGHEIVHAAARHGAQSMEKGMLLQGAVLAAGIAAQDKSYANLIVGGAQLSSKLVAIKFGRDDESEADLYGMQYMKKAGYDPRAAVTLQETFVRLSQNHQSSFIEGLFASHPPSEERVAANKATLATIGEGGEWGREIYAQKVGKLKATQAAYKDYDEGVQALSKGDAAKASVLAKQAAAAEPREARFQELLGDIALSKKQNKEALGHYENAIKMQPGYFRPLVQSGIALNNLGRKVEAETYLKRSNELLPTAPSFYLLGQLAEERGDVDTALKNYETASGSDSNTGRSSTERYLRLDLPRNPAKYLQASTQIDSNGNLFVSILNPTSVPVAKVRIQVTRYDPATNRANGQSQLQFSSPIAANQRGQLAVPGMQLKAAAELKFYEVAIEAAELAK
jgi:predicted Zn-dependent protease